MSASDTRTICTDRAILTDFHSCHHNVHQTHITQQNWRISHTTTGEQDGASDEISGPCAANSGSCAEQYYDIQESHWITALHMLVNSKAELIISRIWGLVDDSKDCPSNSSYNSRILDQRQDNKIIYICLWRFNTAMYSSNQIGNIRHFITSSSIQNRMDAAVWESMSKFCPLNSSCKVWG